MKTSLATPGPGRLTLIRMAGAAFGHIEDAKRGIDCWMADHAQRLNEMKPQVEAVLAALDEIEASLPEMSETGRPAAEAVISRIRRTLRR